MPTPTPINSKHNADKKTALLVLAAKAKEVPRGNCPLPEEMALLIEGKSKAKDTEQLLSHIAQCETCFEEWFTLSAIQDKQQKSPLRHLNKRVLSYAGSALAAAASVVIFLNISQQPILETAILPAPSPSLEQTVEQKSDIILFDKREKEAAVSSAIQETHIDQQVPSAKSKTERTASQALGVAPVKNFEKPAMAPMKSVPKKTYSIPLPTYLNALRNGCSGGIKPGEFWLEQLVSGKKQFPDYFTTHPTLQVILLQLGQHGAQEEQCQLLLKELDQ